MKKELPIAFLSLLTVFNVVNAQNLVLTLSNSSPETFAVADLRSIKFSAGAMVLSKTDGTINSWNIDDIDNYAFNEVSSITEESIFTTDELKVFPNPSSYLLQINYSSNKAEEIRIEIYDVNGKLVVPMFHGNHREVTVLNWDFKQKGMLPSGHYLIKVTTPNKIITKPVIIH